MWFWIREIAGWALVAVSLVLVWQALVFAMNTDDPQIVQAFVVMMGAVGVMRAGVLLVRISTAARLSRDRAD
jgi:hypothetical protein